MKINFLKIPLGLYRSANKRDLLTPILFYFRLREFSKSLVLPKKNFLTAFSIKMGISKSVLYKNMDKISFLYSQTESDYILSDWEEAYVLCGLRPTYIDQYYYLPILKESKDIQIIWMYLELYYSFRADGWDELANSKNLIEASNGTISIDLLGYKSERNGGNIRETLENLKLIKTTNTINISFQLHPKAILEGFFSQELEENIDKALEQDINIIESTHIDEGNPLLLIKYIIDGVDSYRDYLLKFKDSLDTS